MLYTIPDLKKIESMPYEDEYIIWRKRLNNSEYQAIVDALNHKVDTGDVHTSSWIPGANWEGTVYHPIYEKSCLMDVNQAAICFGLFLWVVMMEREDSWSFGRYEK